MNKYANLTAATVLTILAVTMLIRMPSSHNDLAPATSQTISIEDVHRAADVATLPVQEVKEPF